jgi:hypothetical protein
MKRLDWSVIWPIAIGLVLALGGTWWVKSGWDERADLQARHEKLAAELREKRLECEPGSHGAKVIDGDEIVWVCVGGQIVGCGWRMSNGAYYDNCDKYLKQTGDKPK